MSTMNFIFFVILIFFPNISICGRFSKCRIGKNTEFHYISDFENNIPRENEIIRAKFYFQNNGFIQLHSGKHFLYFGELKKCKIELKNILKLAMEKGRSQYSVFKSASDFISGRYSCDSGGEIVPEDTFVEFDLVLESKFLNLKVLFYIF